MPLPECFEHDTLDDLTCNPSSQALRGALQAATGPLPCDKYHHFYHYQSSTQYVWLADTLRALNRMDEAMTAYDRAIFQDHFNHAALDRKKIPDVRLFVNPPAYDKHPPFDLQFRGLIGELPDDATQPHDAGALALQASDITKALMHFEEAIAISSTHSNSFFGRGRCHFLKGDFEKAAADLAEAVRLSHLRHDAYHRTASAEHLARGREFLKNSFFDLAINDFTKALDLHRGNKEALAERAKTYRSKGNDKLAEEDELKLTPRL